MMKIFTFFSICIFLALSGFAQNEGSVSEMNASLFAPNFSLSKQKLLDFVSQHAAKVNSQDETERQIHIVFYLQKDDFTALSAFIPQLGFISNKNISTSSNQERLSKINLEIEYITQQNAAFNLELKSMTSKDERYYNYWKEIRDNEKKIFDLRAEVQTLTNKTGYLANITIYDDVTDLTSKISWVNMPGASYDLLWIESPLKGLSSSTYRGVHLKYLFTRGKTYATLGTYRSASTVADSAQYSELFTVGFGQDFYTKHFGRGKNKWLNLYSGYELGLAYCTSNKDSRTMITGQVFTGLEIFKNKYFLLDNKVGYFVPFSNLNRNMRGVVYSVSVNFVL